MKKIIVVDPDKCTGCMMCTMACSLRKTRTFNPGRSRIKIIHWEEKGTIVPVLCQHCEEPVCLPCCPVEAITRNEKTGIVDIHQETCVNCNICRKACPFGAPSLDSVEKQVVICDLCGGAPACVSSCPSEALEYAEADGKNLIKRRRTMGEIRKSILDLKGK